MSSYVYMIGCAQADAIKIGFTTRHPSTRLKELISTGTPGDLTILSHTYAQPSYERELHKRFKHLRIRGEWFRDDPELRALAHYWTQTDIRCQIARYQDAPTMRLKLNQMRSAFAWGYDTNFTLKHTVEYLDRLLQDQWYENQRTELRLVG